MHSHFMQWLCFQALCESWYADQAASKRRKHLSVCSIRCITGSLLPYGASFHFLWLSGMFCRMGESRGVPNNASLHNGNSFCHHTSSWTLHHWTLLLLSLWTVHSWLALNHLESRLFKLGGEKISPQVLFFLLFFASFSLVADATTLIFPPPETFP